MDEFPLYYDKTFASIALPASHSIALMWKPYVRFPIPFHPFSYTFLPSHTNFLRYCSPLHPDCISFMKSATTHAWNTF